MQKIEHTAGPWELECGDEGWFEIHVLDGTQICQRAEFNHRAEESKANGRLIAAAPELLEALKAVQLFHYGCNWHHEDDCSLSCGGPACDCGCDLVKEAIRKAESE